MGDALKQQLERLKGKLATLYDSLDSWKREANRFKNKWMVSEDRIKKLFILASLLCMLSIIENILSIWIIYHAK